MSFHHSLAIVIMRLAVNVEIAIICSGLETTAFDNPMYDASSNDDAFPGFVEEKSIYDENNDVASEDGDSQDEEAGFGDVAAVDSAGGADGYMDIETELDNQH